MWAEKLIAKRQVRLRLPCAPCEIGRSTRTQQAALLHNAVVPDIVADTYFIQEELVRGGIVSGVFYVCGKIAKEDIGM